MSFVSARELEASRLARKEEVRVMREEILREAKESFEKEKRREELKRVRGEDTWMLPAVKKRLGLKGESSHSASEKKKKRKKEKKKHKKHKTSKTTKKEVSDSGSEGSGEEGEGEWVEKGNTDSPPAVSEDQRSSVGAEALPPAQLQRDEWMMLPLGPSDKALSIMTKREKEEADKETKAEEVNFLDKPGQHPRELNPFWRAGGSGLPSTENGAESNPSAVSVSRESGERSSSSSSNRKTVGDGGHSWLLRAYKRVMEQAKDSGRSVEEIAVERWGSLKKLHSLLRAAGIDPENPDAPPRGRREREYLYSRTRRLDEDRDRRSVREFDRRRDREGKRERRVREVEKGGEQGADRERGEVRSERASREEYRRKEGDIERRKREWKEGLRNSRSYHSSDPGSSGGFLKPGDLDQGKHSYPAGIGGGSVGGSGQGWRKKKLIDDTTGQPTDTNKQDLPSFNFSHASDQIPAAISEEVGMTEADREQPEMPVPQEPVTEAQLNSLGAKLMKAELMGDVGKVEKLKKELEKLREVKKFQENASTGVVKVSNREEKTLILTKIDRFGREKPAQFPSTSRGYKPPSKGSTHSKKGKREKYFHDDDRYSLKELVEQEKMMTADEAHAAIARMASKFVPATASDETVDDVVDSKAAMRYDETKEMDKAKKRSMMESRKMADVVDKCQFCFDNKDFNKHLLVAVGMNTYLCAPWHTSLTEGHCFIVPMEHVTCSLYLDENVWSEMEIFRKGLTQMFADHELDVVFMETFTSVKRRSHMYIDCIPIPKEEGELAPMYFKKAILESDEEWAQNKKLIDTREKGVRGSLPRGLPYFFAEFGKDGGFGHVIEDLDQFPHYFGREVVGGLLDLNPQLWLKPRREDFDRQKVKVLQLNKWWAPYDWTQKLKSN